MKKVENYPSWLVPVGMAKSLKKAGFDSPCEFFLPLDIYEDFNTDELSFDYNRYNYNSEIGYLSIPTYDQVFEWFRSKGVYSRIPIRALYKHYTDIMKNQQIKFCPEFTFDVAYHESDKDIVIDKIKTDFKSDENYDTYEAAREQLIYRMIEFYKMLVIAKPKKPANIKSLAFQYVVIKLIGWLEDVSGCSMETNKLPINPIMEYLFLLSGVDRENHLFDIFDNFQAWTLNISESDIYKEYSDCKGVFEFVGISKDVTCVFDGINLLTKLPKDVKLKIDNAFVKLKEKNINLINYSRTSLTNLVKAHHSYDIYHNRLKKPYVRMDKEMLITEPKYFN